MVTAQPDDRLWVDAQRVDDTAKRAHHVVAREGLVARRNGGVRGEHQAPACRLEGGFDGRSPCHLATRQLEGGECGVPLVEVHEGWFYAHGRERADASNAEQRVLRQPNDRVLNVELRGDPPLETAVLGPIGIEQQQRDATDRHAPDLRCHLGASDRYRDRERVPICPLNERGGEPLWIDVNPIFLLPPRHVEALAKIPLSIQQTDGHQRQCAIRPLLEQVTGQRPQST